MRRTAAVIAITLGMALIAVPFALSLFSRTSSAERVTDRFRHMMSAEGLVELRTDFETVRGTGEELIQGLLPRLARELGISEAELDRLIKTEFPATATGVQEVPAVLAFVDPVIDKLEADAKDFRAADSIPVGDVPLTVGPWVFIGIGVAFIIAGVFVLTGARSGLVAALLFGLAVAAAPLAVSFPQKASDGDRVAAVARIGLSQEGADKAQHAMVVLDAMFAEIDHDLIPAMEQRLQLSDAAFRQLIATDFPKVNQGLARWSEIRLKGHSLADKQTASVGDFAAADRIPYTTLPWLLVGSGGVLAGVASAALVQTRRRTANAIGSDARIPLASRDPEKVMS
jgi:hypothetical protein